jgi:[protein-PII] uridylyltransferase
VIPERVHTVRGRLAEGREALRAQFATRPGPGAAAGQAAMLDELIVALADAALSDLGPAARRAFGSEVALVAVGGYGRGDLAPHSDVDLLVLHRPAARRVAGEVGERLVRDLWDAGLTLGSSLREVAECVALAREDLTIHTGLLEARAVAGGTALVESLRGGVLRLTAGTRFNPFADALLAERRKEQEAFGSSVYLLEPDVKHSRGGLRELHVWRWLARARHGEPDVDRVRGDGGLSPADAAVLQSAHESLLRVRWELHLRANRAQDVLHFDEQARLASAFGYRDAAGMLGVERFMRDYYRRSAALDDVVERFVRHGQVRSSWLGPWSARRVAVDRDAYVEGGELCLVAGRPSRFEGGPVGALELVLLAQGQGVALAVPARERLRAAAAAPADEAELSEARRRFLEALAPPGAVATLLRRLRDVNLLDRLVPEFAHARGLIQFNQYHKYTIDEHTILALAHCDALAADPGPVGAAYREVAHKDILHLALVLHDLGKGMDGDHSEIGRGIAEATAARFGLEPHRAEVLAFLVHRHLLMTALAWRRDTEDERVLTGFAREVGTAEVLRMLYVLSAADATAVAPGALSAWKAELLGGLYERAREWLSGEVPADRAGATREALGAAVRGTLPADWAAARIAAMPEAYLRRTPVARAVADLRAIHALGPVGVGATAEADPARGVTAYAVYAREGIVPDPFARVAGVLAAKGLNVARAQIDTFAGGIVVDRFEVLDADPAAGRASGVHEDVCGAIADVLLGRRSPESFATRRVRRPRAPGAGAPARVVVDNETSARHTILDVFAEDRQGLLAAIARAIFASGLSVGLAKITTHLDQALDVFYVTDATGAKVRDEARLEAIRGAILAAVAGASGG